MHMIEASDAIELSSPIYPRTCSATSTRRPRYLPKVSPSNTPASCPSAKPLASSQPWGCSGHCSCGGEGGKRAICIEGKRYLRCVGRGWQMYQGECVACGAGQVYTLAWLLARRAGSLLKRNVVAWPTRQPLQVKWRSRHSSPWPSWKGSKHIPHSLGR